MDEARIIELEIRFTQQQELLEELSGVLYEQQRLIEALRAELGLLKKKVEAEPGMVDAKQHERPPHY
ncbi:SlyX family protein [Myxococcaceae bacterium GXIMD 01537]